MKTITEARALMNTRRNIPREENGRKVIDLTPTWAEIIGQWLMIVRDNSTKHLPEFETEMRRMAETAERWQLFADANPEEAAAFMEAEHG